MILNTAAVAEILADEFNAVIADSQRSAFKRHLAGWQTLNIIKTFIGKRNRRRFFWMRAFRRQGRSEILKLLKIAGASVKLETGADRA